MPAIPLSDVEGNRGTLFPAQIVRDVPKLKLGGIFGLIVTLKEKDVAHNPAVGVKM